MRTKTSFVVLCLLILAAVGYTATHIFLKAEVTNAQFLSLAENQVSSFLNAQVHLGAVRVGGMNKIAFSELEIGSPESRENAFRFRVDQIVFQYPFWKILMRKFQSPTEVIFKEPRLLISSEEFPYELFHELRSLGGSKQISSLKLEGGEIQYLLPGWNTNFVLKDIQGAFEPTGVGKVRVHFKAQAEGVLSGTLQMRGIIDPIKRSHELELLFEEGELSPEIRLPLKGIQGRLEWVDADLFLRDIHTRVHGWTTVLNGKIQNLTSPEKMIVSVDAEFGEKETLGEASLKLDFTTHEIRGGVKPLRDRPYEFYGEFSQDGSQINFGKLVLDHRYHGNGKMDFGSGDYAFLFREGDQEVSIQSNLEHLKFFLNLRMNHLQLAGLDLVTSTSLEIAPVENVANAKNLKFQVFFTSDYFILEQMPFDDFKGSFMISPLGLSQLKARWGTAFSLEGSIPLKTSGYESNLVVEVDGFELSQVKEFSAKPFHKAIAGTLDGKLRILGDPTKPEMIGDFSVKDGQVGKLKYDKGIIHFRGFPPYLALSESKILRGRSSLDLVGPIDFSLSNIFHGVRIQTADKIVLWQGWEINTNEEEGDFEISRLESYLPALVLRAGAQSGDTFADSDLRRDDRYVTLGSKIKF